MIISSFGKNIHIDISGGSHEKAIFVEIWGLPANLKISMESVRGILDERRSKSDGISTARVEDDLPLVWSPLTGKYVSVSNIHTAENFPIIAKFNNNNFNSAEYDSDFPRPGHCDLPAKMKYGNEVNLSGGGPFSGRMTVALCFAGAVAMEILKLKGIDIGGQVLSVGNEKNTPISLENPHSSPISDIMISEAAKAKSDDDSVGGTLEVFAKGLPLGLGGPLFDNLESEISSCVFSIPAVKGIEFGAGFKSSQMTGSKFNDPILRIEPTDHLGYKMVTSKNDSGGILGGLSTGMPLTLRVAIKPTPTISSPQKTIDFKTGKNIEHTFHGRHDACIVPRALPCVKSALALCLLDKLIERDLYHKTHEVLPEGSPGRVVGDLPKWLKPSKNKYAFMDLSSLRSQVLATDQKIQNLLEERLILTDLIGEIKKESSLGIFDEDRERTVLSHLDIKWHDVFRHIMAISRAEQANCNKELFGLVGSHLSHSYSKKIHESFGEYKYHLIEVDSENFEKFIMDADFTGLNLTFPYKEAVMAYLHPTAVAKKIGAANTVFFNSKGKLVGTNTDYDGFCHLVNIHGVKLSGKKILILGNGGAGKAVQHAVLSYSPRSVAVATRQNLNEIEKIKKISYMNYGDLTDEYDVIINATILGNSPDVNRSPVNLKDFGKCKAAIDIIYNPFMTEFLLRGKLLGKKVVGGLTMLVGQAISASNYFIASAEGIDFSKELAFPDFLLENMIKCSVANILHDTLDIVIIGMSGAGKTTIGRELAKRLNMPFIDIDEEIEKNSEKSIREYFATGEEDSFRKLEAAAVDKIFSIADNLSSKIPRVIATGGGTISSMENIKLISKNSLIIYLDRDLNLIKAKDNPIYENISKRKLYDMRNPIYSEISHIHIKHKNSVKSTLNKIVSEVESYYEKDYFN